MEHWWEWVLSILGSGAVAASLVGIAGYLFRAQLSHLLNKDLEAIKARHQRDLETYKVGLIAETERAKASQALRTAGAMKIVEKKFEAIESLHAATIGLSSYVYAVSRSDLQHRTNDDRTAVNKRVEAFDDARERIGPFLNAERRAIFFAFKQALHPMVRECFKTVGPLLTEDEAQVLVDAAIAAELNVDALVAQLINEMGNLDQ